MIPNFIRVNRYGNPGIHGYFDLRRFLQGPIHYNNDRRVPKKDTHIQMAVIKKILN